MSINEWIHIIAMAVLALIIIISFLWWAIGLAHGIFPLTQFITLMAGIIIAGLLSDKEQR